MQHRMCVPARTVGQATRATLQRKETILAMDSIATLVCAFSLVARLHAHAYPVTQALTARQPSRTHVLESGVKTAAPVLLPLTL